MGKKRALEHFKTITDKEMKILTTVTYKYNFQLISAEKVGNGYEIVTDKGNFCLKRTKHGRNKAKNGYLLTEELLLNKFTNIAKYFRPKDGAFYVSHKKYIFYLTQWLGGTECDLNNIDEVVNCTKLLAEFHKVSNEIGRDKVHIRNNSMNLPRIFARDLNDIEKFNRIIIGKRVKNEFDILFLENAETFYNRGMLAVNMLMKSEYYKVAKIAKDKRIICYNSLYYKNIIKLDGEYFITDLDSIKIDLEISDLGEFIRRLMFKKAYRWDFNIAKVLIEAYNSINRINKEDLEIMIATIIFPHKFLELGKKRFTKQKKWSETKYLHKLNKIISFDEMEEVFLRDYLIYFEDYF
ncbi:MAG: CotS family spore coat protein [Clostridiaceae bacterium]|nr:CotS family spore coat protein [Clostridiaceae bacterium]